MSLLLFFARVIDMPKILFMGSDAVCLPLLERLKERAAQLCVVSQPDRPHGRGQKLKPNAVSAWALENAVVLHRPEKLTAAFLEQLKEFAPTVTIVMAYGKILKPSYLELAQHGTWNLHASDLPALRGASPIETAIALGLEQTATCLMAMEVGMDTGGVAAKADIEIPSTMHAPKLREVVAQSSAQLVVDNWDALISGELTPKAQDPAAATYCRLINKADSFLDFGASAKANLDRIRAFGSWLGVGFEHKGAKIKVFEAALADDLACESSKPGEILENDGRLVVACAQEALELTKLQRPGGKVLNVRDFLRGYGFELAEVLPRVPFRELTRPQPFARGF